MKNVFSFENIDRKEFGRKALKLGKHIFIEGSKAVALQAATKAINTGFEDGFGTISSLKFDDLVGNKTKKGSI